MKKLQPMTARVYAPSDWGVKTYPPDNWNAIYQYLIATRSRIENGVSTTELRHHVDGIMSISNSQFYNILDDMKKAGYLTIESR